MSPFHSSVAISMAATTGLLDPDQRSSSTDPSWQPDDPLRHGTLRSNGAVPVYCPDDEYPHLGTHRPASTPTSGHSPAHGMFSQTPGGQVVVPAPEAQYRYWAPLKVPEPEVMVPQPAPQLMVCHTSACPGA